MNGLRAGMAAPPLMAAARVAAGVTSLTCQEPTFTGPLPNRRSRPKADLYDRASRDGRVDRERSFAHYGHVEDGGSGVIVAKPPVGARRWSRSHRQVCPEEREHVRIEPTSRHAARITHNICCTNRATFFASF
jgi:hypothetical protein